MSEPSDLTGQTIVITGAASGLGKAWAVGFLREGARVVGVDINAAGLEPLAALGAITVVADVSDPDAVRGFIELAAERTGRVDVLFNNAGQGQLRRFEQQPAGEFEAHIAVHLFGTVYGMRFALPIMRRQGRGRIINTISRAAESAAGKWSAYSAAKAGIWAASRAVAQEMEDADILINMLIPGPTNTGIWGVDRPEMQSAEVTYPTARLLATLPADGPRGKVFWNEREYPLFRGS